MTVVNMDDKIILSSVRIFFLSLKPWELHDFEDKEENFQKNDFVNFACFSVIKKSAKIRINYTFSLISQQ